MDLVVLVPVLSRPHNAAPLAASLAAGTTTPYRLVWLCSPSDDEQIAACKEAGGDVMVMTWEAGWADFSRKINYGFEHTTEPWIFQAADDLRFTGGWDVQAFVVAKRTDRGVIGTQDLGNPLVRRGVHSTHTLFSRAYIERYGGTVDNTGAVFSEAYAHECCDHEFIETAKARGQFAMSKRSVVEHLHPHWGKAETDSTYQKATANSRKDRELYMLRMRNVRTPELRRERQQEKREARLARRKMPR